jgi:CHAD domain-containing protein
MADGKWIDGLRPDLPLPIAARRVLEVRLRVVSHYLPLAVHESERDPENVHQLRVGTRRAGAAVRIFRACLPDKTRKNLKRTLRAIRRAAGAARDWDVFLLDLQARRKERPAPERPGLDFLTGFGLSQRQVAQKELETAEQEHGNNLGPFTEEAVISVHVPHDGKSTLLDLAMPTLARLENELETAAATDLTDYANLHRVRIAGKRLRYAMEVFADCFGLRFRDEVYPQVEQMQEILGRANDSHVAAGRLAVLRERLRQGWPEEWKNLRAGIESLLRMHQRRLPQERRRFLKWWENWQHAEIVELGKRLTETVNEAARRPGPAGMAPRR